MSNGALIFLLEATEPHRRFVAQFPLVTFSRAARVPLCKNEQSGEVNITFFLPHGVMPSLAIVPAIFLRQAGLFSVYISQEKTRRKVASKLKTRCSASGTVLGLAISNLTLFGSSPFSEEQAVEFVLLEV